MQQNIMGKAAINILKCCNKILGMKQLLLGNAAIYICLGMQQSIIKNAARTMGMKQSIIENAAIKYREWSNNNAGL